MPFNVGTAVGYLDLDTSGFTRGFQTALSSLRTFQSESATISDKLAAVGTSLTSAGSTLTKAVTVPILGLGTAAVTTTAQFESAMSQVQATMGITKDAMTELDGSTVNSMDALSALAQELGATTKFSAVEAAEAINYMALAGYDVATTYGMLPTVLDLAAAGNFDLARASDMVTDSQTALGLSVEETATMVDEWARAASRSNTSVEQLGDAILTIGGTAQYMSGGTDRLATVLGILADNGIKGSEAGTKLRNMVLKLASPTKDGAAALEELGVAIFDSAGNMRDFQDIFLDFASAMEGMTEEQKITYFSDLFNVRDVAAANALLNTSVERWEELGAAISDADGAARQMSETQLDNLNGQLTILKSSLEGLAISFGELLLPLIKDITSGVQSVVTWLNNLDEGQKQTIVRILEIAAAIGPVMLVLGKLITTISSVGKAISLLELVLSGLAASSGPIALVIAIIGVLVAAFVTLWNTSEEFRNNIIATFESIQKTLSEFYEGVQERLSNFGVELGSFTDTLKTLWEGFCNILAPLFEGAFAMVADVLSFALDEMLLLFDLFSAVFSGDWEATWEAVKGILNNAWELIVNIFSNFLDMLLGVFGTTKEELWSRVTDLAENIWAKVTQTAQDVWDGITKVVNDIVDFFKTLPQTISDILAEVVAWFEGLPERIGYAIGFVVGTIARWAVDVYNAVVEEVPKIIDKVVTFFSELPEKLWTWLVKTVDKIEKWVSESVRKVNREVPEIINTIIDFFKELPEKVWAWFSQVVDKIGTWVSDMIQKIRELFPQVVEEILSFFRSLPSQLTSIGTDLIEGLWEGIQGASSWIGNKAESVGNKVVEGFRRAFDSHSPSRKMIAQGEYLMEGLAIGIDDGESTVFSVLQDLFGALFNRFDTLITQLDRILSFNSLSFADEQAQNDLLQYNSLLLTTLDIYRSIESCLKTCATYTEQLYKEDYFKAISLVSQVSQSMQSPSMLANNSVTESNKNEAVIVSYLSQLLQIAKLATVSEPKQPVVLVCQVSGKEISRVVVDDINTFSRMSGGDVVR